VNSSWIKRAAKLEKEGKPFVLATVINASGPTAAKPVAKAIITPDGKMEGWIGGGCSKEVVVEEALKCLNSDRSTILRVTPEPDTSLNHSVKEVLLACESGGTLELHIEPVLPMTKLLVYGSTPAATALVKMASVMDFDIHLFGSGATHVENIKGINLEEKFLSPKGRCVSVIATQGEGDLDALKAAVKTEALHIFFIASRKKGEEVTAGFSPEDLGRIKFPAGLDIGAVTPEEIAVSILAEIVQAIRSQDSAGFREESEETSMVKDPVCGMEVNPAKTSHSVEYKGETVYFCCDGCVSQFTATPEKFADMV